MYGDFNHNRINPYSNILEFQDTETLGLIDSGSLPGFINDGGGHYGGGYNAGYFGGDGGGGTSNGQSSNSTVTVPGGTITLSPTNSLVTGSTPAASLPVNVITSPNQQVVSSDIEKRSRRLKQMQVFNAGEIRSRGSEERKTNFESIKSTPQWVSMLPKQLQPILANESIRLAVMVGFGAIAALFILNFISKKRGRK